MCKQEFTGTVRVGLAEAWCARVESREEEDEERLAAANNLATGLHERGRCAEAEMIMLDVLATSKRVLGEEHPITLTSVSYLASTYKRPGQVRRS